MTRKPMPYEHSAQRRINYRALRPSPFPLRQIADVQNNGSILFVSGQSEVHFYYQIASYGLAVKKHGFESRSRDGIHGRGDEKWVSTEWVHSIDFAGRIDH